MKKNCIITGLLFAAVHSLYAQGWTAQDSLKLHQLLQKKGELELNSEALKSLQIESVIGNQKVLIDKPWLDFDNSLPAIPHEPEKKIVLTLHPYTANTRYNWDPIYQKKVTVRKDTWRSDPYYALSKLSIYTNWAKHPFDKGVRKSREEIEATGLRYTSHLEGNILVNEWGSVGAPSGHDFMTVFTKDFWSPKARKRRARTLEVLKTYGDSTTVLIKNPISNISNK